MYKLRNGYEIRVEDLNDMELKGMSETQIAEFYEISRMNLYKIRRKMGWKQLSRSDKGVERKSKEEKRKNWNKYMREYQQVRRLGGDYKVVIYDGKRILEHRLVMMKFLGRELRKGEVVHHKGDIRDNRIENLRLFASQRQYMRYHYLQKLGEVL
jgi:hypothetical protein